MSSTIIWILTLILITLGVLGVVVPFLPGIGLIFAGILFYAWMTNFSVISLGTVIIFGLIALLAWFVEYLGSVFGAKFGGGGRYAIWGSLLGGLAGLVFIGPLGLLLGVIIGVLIGALYEGKTLHQAGKTVFFSIIGILGAKLIQLLMALGLIVAFIVTIFA